MNRPGQTDIIGVQGEISKDIKKIKSRGDWNDKGGFAMTIFTPYMNVDLYQRRPDWQKIERYEYCSTMNVAEKKGIVDRVKAWFKKEDSIAA